MVMKSVTQEGMH